MNIMTIKKLIVKRKYKLDDWKINTNSLCNFKLFVEDKYWSDDTHTIFKTVRPQGTDIPGHGVFLVVQEVLPPPPTSSTNNTELLVCSFCNWCRYTAGFI